MATVGFSPLAAAVRLLNKEGKNVVAITGSKVLCYWEQKYVIWSYTVDPMKGCSTYMGTYLQCGNYEDATIEFNKHCLER
jgi:hypothetical protein